MAKNQNIHLEHIVNQLDAIEDGLEAYIRTNYKTTEERISSPLFSLEKRVEQLHAYVRNLREKEPELVIEKPCWDCGQEEANPGLDVCGSCYHKRIFGRD